MALALRYAVRSDVGLLREGNEDSAYAGPYLLAVADGMGGYEAGEVASASVISTMAPLDRYQRPESELVDALAEATDQAKERLRSIADSDPSVGSMGTTLTAMLWSGGTAAICHIGDSRAYLLREGDLYQITRDHTFVQALVDQGRIRPGEAATHPQRSLLLRALDGRNDADPDLSLLTAHEGDRVLLCSDGLPVAVSDDDIARVLAGTADPTEAVMNLIDLAIRGGGPDNITCIVADVIDTAHSMLPPTKTPVVVGAAAAGADTLNDTRPIAMPADQGAPGTAGPHRISGLPPEAPPVTADGLAADDQSGNDGDDDASGGRRPRRRRWPVMTAILVLFVLLLGSGLITGYQYVRSQYFVGSYQDTVVIYRGVNERLFGMSLAGVAQRTGIPLAGVPKQDAQVVRASAAGSLAQAQRIVANIRRDYLSCKNGYAALRQWEAGKPRPRRVKKTVNGKIVYTTVTPPYRKPRPVIPPYCPPESAYAT